MLFSKKQLLTFKPHLFPNSSFIFLGSYIFFSYYESCLQNNDNYHIRCVTLYRGISQHFPAASLVDNNFWQPVKNLSNSEKKRITLYFSPYKTLCHSQTWLSYFGFNMDFAVNQQEMPFWSKQISPRNLYNINLNLNNTP